MKIGLYFFVGMACLVGLALADFGSMYGGSLMSGGYGGYGGGGGGYGGYNKVKAQYVPVPITPRRRGGGGLLPLLGLLLLMMALLGTSSMSGNSDQIMFIFTVLGLLFLMMALLGNNNSSGSTDQIILLNSTVSG